MADYRTRTDALIQPKGHRHYRDPARLDYRTKTEMRAQLIQYARTKWPTARRIDVDLNTREIVIDGRPAANYTLHAPKETR